MSVVGLGEGETRVPGIDMAAGNSFIGRRRRVENGRDGFQSSKTEKRSEAFGRIQALGGVGIERLIEVFERENVPGARVKLVIDSVQPTSTAIWRGTQTSALREAK